MEPEGGADAARRFEKRARKNPVPRGISRTVLAIVLALAAWGVSATVAGVVVANEAAQARQAQLWDTESTLLVAVSQDFAVANYSTGRYLATRDWALGNSTVAALESASILAHDLQGTPANAVSDALNLSDPRFMCTGIAYQDLLQTYMGTSTNANVTFYRTYFAEVANITGTVRILLLAVGPTGTDPLTQLGPTKAATVAALMGQWYRLDGNVDATCAYG